MITICIDPGHGGSDPGSMGNNLQEKDITLRISLLVAKALKNLPNITVIMTRADDRFIDLTSERTPEVDISISIHVNAGGGQGLETWVSLFNQSEESNKLGQFIQSAILSKVPFTNRGLKTKYNSSGNADYLYMIRNPSGIPVLVECGFIDSESDAEILKSDSNLQEIANGIVEGIKNYLGIEDDNSVADWKQNIIYEAKEAGIISGDHNPDDTATKWFVLGIALAVLKKVLK